MKKIVVFTGAGISAESGIKTFRDSGGLWEQYNIEEIATPQAWAKDPDKVTEFYNLRRKQVMEAEPNEAHKALAALEKYFSVEIITQNIDDLHERAGSKKILHLHGEIRKARSSIDPSLIYPVKEWELKKEDKCEKGSRLRPHVVWFGEEVPNMEKAYNITERADILLIIGTSLNVYPAAGLINFTQPHCRVYLIDPNAQDIKYINNLTVIKEKASRGVKALAEKLIKEKTAIKG